MTDTGFILKIPAPLQPLVDSTRLQSLGLLKQMQPGQLLQARVAAATTAGVAKLLVGSTELLAKTRVPLQQGENLALRVEKGLPQPELKILRSIVQQPVRQLLLSALARQLPPQDVQQTLRQLPAAALLRNETVQQAQQVQQLRQVLRVLVPNAPMPQQVNAATVKQAMQYSGIFFEPNLAQGVVLPHDQKFQLLQLLRLFSPQARVAVAGEKETVKAAGEQKSAGAGGSDQLLNRLLRLVEGSLSRIQSHQASSLSAEEPNRQVWQFEMPLQLADRQDQLHIRVQRDEPEAKDEGEAKRIWKVDIDFDFDNLGSIFSRINLSGENVSAAFWSQRDSTAAIIERAIPRLEAALIEAGLEVSAISSLTGDAPRPPTPAENLLDERA